LIQSFVSGLSDFLTTLVPSVRTPMRTIHFNVLAGVTKSWTADANYDFVAGYFTAGGSPAVLSRDGSLVTTINPASTIVIQDSLLWWGSGSTVPQMITNIRVPIASGSKVYLYNGGASACMMLLYLERT
jgi:hypothetical protein